MTICLEHDNLSPTASWSCQHWCWTWQIVKSELKMKNQSYQICEATVYISVQHNYKKMPACRVTAFSNDSVHVDKLSTCWLLFVMLSSASVLDTTTPMPNDVQGTNLSKVSAVVSARSCCCKSSSWPDAWHAWFAQNVDKKSTKCRSIVYTHAGQWFFLYNF